jgi:hypothetical protein
MPVAAEAGIVEQGRKRSRSSMRMECRLLLYVFVLYNFDTIPTSI